MLDSIVPPPNQIKILVVDDDEVNLDLMSRFLRPEGYQVVSARSGEEGLENIAREKLSLVLLDVMMAGMDGFEVCRRIKNNPATLFLPVVLVTGLSETEDRVKGAAAGADDFLNKPWSEQELLTRVKSLLRVKFLHDALEVANQRLRQMLDERTRQLDMATRELQKLLEERACQTTADLVPASYSRPTTAAPAAEAGPATGAADQAALREFRRTLLGQLSGTLEGRTDLSRTPEMVSMLSEQLAAIYEASGLQLPGLVRQQLFREVIDEIVGFGPIERLLSDETVSEIMVNGPHRVYAERKGRLVRTEVEFDDDDHVRRIIDRIIRPLGRRVDRNNPMVDARLPDGSRVNAIIAPCAIDGPTITIRKFSKNKLTIDDIINFGSVTPAMANFLKVCVSGRLNILVSGGTGSGKTTLLNVLSGFIPEHERIVTIEDSAELQLSQEHVVRLETKPADVDGTGEVSIRSLVKNSLRMRPDRIIVGEVRSGEALDMLQAMNTGHDGSLATIHANTPRDTIGRLETLVLMAGMDLPLKVVRSQIASAVELIVQQARLQDGSRKVTQITEVQGMEGDTVVLSDIFVFKEKGVQDDKVVGDYEATGIRPKFSSKLQTLGFHLSAELFMPPAGADSLARRGGRSPR